MFSVAASCVKGWRIVVCTSAHCAGEDVATGMTALVLTFVDHNGMEQAQSAAVSRGLDCHAFPQGLMRLGSNSFYRRWLARRLPGVLPSPSVMVVPLMEMTKSDNAPSLLFDLALSVSRPEEVTGYVISD